MTFSDRAGNVEAQAATQVAAMLEAFGKPVKEYQQVDVGEKLAELGLAKHFPSDVRSIS